ncbi:MAG: peptidylprolyl isomerase [Leucothrix sp.]
MDMNKTTDRMTQIIKPATWLAAALLSLSATAAFSADASLDRVVAVVNKDIILSSEVQQVARRLQVSGSKETDNTVLLKQALESLVSERLQLQAAKRVGINPNAASLDRAVNSVAARNNLNLDQFKQALKNQGIDYAGFRETIASQLIINSLKQRRSTRNNEVTEQDVSDLITAEARQITAKRSYHIQDILIPKPASADTASYNQAKRRAIALRKSALSNPDFMKTSQANSTASDLGWKSSDSLSFVYLAELTKLEPGQISDVITDARGFHILKLVDQRGGKSLTSQQVRVRHILVANSEPNANAKINSLRQQLIQGADFGNLAKANSDDTGSAVNSGDLGWSDSKRYVPQFAKASETLALNTLSPVIKTKFGYHVLEVLDRREIDASRRALETQARQLILNKKQEQDYDAWVQGLRSTAFIEYK